MSIVVQGPFSAGHSEHPGVVTYVANPKDLDESKVFVNTTVFPDGSPPVCHMGVPLFRNRAAADVFKAERPRHYAAPIVAFPLEQED
jgi:hypothetical protein